MLANVTLSYGVILGLCFAIKNKVFLQNTSTDRKHSKLDHIRQCIIFALRFINKYTRVFNESWKQAFPHSCFLQIFPL